MTQLHEIRERAISRARWANTVRGPWIDDAGAGNQTGKMTRLFRELRLAEVDLGSLLVQSKKVGETGTALVELPTACPDCGVAAGYTHVEGCDVERCSSCGLQRLGCACVDHDPKLSFWTGYWPGDETTRLLHLNLNELAVLIDSQNRSRDQVGGPH